MSPIELFAAFVGCRADLLACYAAYRVRDEQAEHRAIVDAVVAGDAAAARQAVALHFGRTADIIGQGA